MFYERLPAVQKYIIVRNYTRASGKNVLPEYNNFHFSLALISLSLLASLCEHSGQFSTDEKE